MYIGKQASSTARLADRLTVYCVRLLPAQLKATLTVGGMGLLILKSPSWNLEMHERLKTLVIVACAHA